MQRRLVSLGISLAALFASFIPCSAVIAAHRDDANWSRRDRAVYVVSTMNLLHARSGRSLTTMLVHKLGVTHFDVYADQQVNDLYFIEPRRDDGSSAGALAYQMGWVVPMSLSPSLDKLHLRHAPSRACAAYRNDLKQLIGSFASTFPT